MIALSHSNAFLAAVVAILAMILFFPEALDLYERLLETLAADI